jgi:RimJ/RimL family protein N-acetyltransferase
VLKPKQFWKEHDVERQLRASFFCNQLPTGLVVRVATQADIPGIAHMLASLSSRSRALRYFTPRPLTGESALREAARIVGGPPEQHMALIAADVIEGAHTVVAAGELARDGATATGEIGIVVRDDYQARGIGCHLLRRLLDLAPNMGIQQLRCELLAENRAMLRLIRRAGAHTVVT